MKKIKEALYAQNQRPLDVFVEFIYYMFFFIIFWGVNVFYIPKEWHLFSGWISCVIFKGMFDLVKTINDIE